MAEGRERTLLIGDDRWTFSISISRRLDLQRNRIWERVHSLANDEVGCMCLYQSWLSFDRSRHGCGVVKY